MHSRPELSRISSVRRWRLPTTRSNRCNWSMAITPVVESLIAGDSARKAMSTIEGEGGIQFERSLRAKRDRRSQAALGQTIRVTIYSKKRFVGGYEVANLGYYLNRAIGLLCKRDKRFLIDRQNNFRRAAVSDNSVWSTKRVAPAQRCRNDARSQLTACNLNRNQEKTERKNDEGERGGNDCLK